MSKKFVDFFFQFFFQFFCENKSIDNTRYLATSYFHETMNLPCTSKSASIRNWVTFCDPCDWVRLIPDWFAFWSRFSAWPTTRKGNGVELELPNVFCLTLYYLATALLLHWKKSCENAMTGNTKDEPYQNVCVNRSWHDYD